MVDERETDVVSGIAISPDGSQVFVTGYVGGSFLESGWSMLTVAYDASDGAEVWRALYDGPKGLGDAAFALDVSPDGERVYVVGARDLLGSPYGIAGGRGSFAVVAYAAATGEQLWVGFYDGPVVDGGDAAYAVAVGPGAGGDRVYVTGESFGGGSGVDYATVAFDGQTGARLWVARYDGPVGGRDEPTAIGVSPDGRRVFVTGRSQGQPGASSDAKLDFATVSYDAGTGEQLWVDRYDGPGTGPDFAYALDVSPDSSTVYVVGASSAGEEQTGACLTCTYLTLAYDADSGETRWLARYQGPVGLDFARAVAVDPDGARVFVTGHSVGALTDYVTVAYDAASGDQVWASRTPSPLWDVPTSIAVAPDGDAVYVTGQSYVHVGIGVPTQWLWGEALTVALDPLDGSQIWAARHNSSPVPVSSYSTPNPYSWRSMVVAPDGGSVYVARTLTHPSALFQSENGHDYVTVRYDAR